MVKFNKVKERILFLSPTVQAGWEDESEISDFNLTKVLGKGAFGRVSKAVHKKSNLIYAIKEINKANLKENNMVEQVSNEVKIMYTLNHPNIIKLYNHFEDDTNIYLIQEFATGGQMYQLMWKQPGRRFQEKKVAQYIYQLTIALQKCHQNGIIHRDIKPENLLVDGKGNLKLADFGWSNFLKPNANDVRDTFCGTLDYLAPEMLERGSKHDFNIDIWAIGVLAFELSTGQSPFAPREQQFNANYVDQTTRKNIKSLTYNFPSSFPTLCKDMVQKILLKEPKSRLQLDQILKHPWILEQCADFIQTENEVIEKKEIIKVTEIEDFVKQGKAIFTEDDIYNVTRPDSIINQEFNEKNKTKLNYQSPLPTIQSQNSSISSMNSNSTSYQQSGDGDMKQQIINQLQQKIADLEKKNSLLGLENSKKQKEIDMLKSELSNWNQGQSGQSQTTLQNQLQIEKEKYQNLKKENDYQWGKLQESDKKVRDLQTQIQMMGAGQKQGQDLMQQVLQYKQLYEQSNAELKRLQQQQSPSKSDKQFNQQSQNVDELLSLAKNQTKQSDQGPTKSNKYGF